MMGALAEWRDRLLGRGDAAITVPVLDGALKSNRVIEDADVLATLDAPEDLATDGAAVYVTDGPRVLRVVPGDAGAVSFEPVATAGGTITALACLPGGGFAAAVDGRRIEFHGGPRAGLTIDAAGGRPLVAVNAIAARADGGLVVSDGSATHGPAEWKHDLMALGRSGRVIELAAGGDARVIADGLGHAFGVGAADAGVVFSESWRHRVMIAAGGAPRVLIDGLPGYPSRIAPAGDGGWWVSCFVLRTQLVEFVLREHGFRTRMMREIDPAFWIAPALSSGHTFLEPMQGAQLKMMGVVKPWAPPRSYGLLLRLTADGRIRYSLHSRYDGRHHGIVAVVEHAGALYLLSKGSRRLLRTTIAAAERSLAS